MGRGEDSVEGMGESSERAVFVKQSKYIYASNPRGSQMTATAAAAFQSPPDNQLPLPMNLFSIASNGEPRSKRSTHSENQNSFAGDSQRISKSNRDADFDLS